MRPPVCPPARLLLVFYAKSQPGFERFRLPRARWLELKLTRGNPMTCSLSFPLFSFFFSAADPLNAMNDDRCCCCCCGGTLYILTVRSQRTCQRSRRISDDATCALLAVVHRVLRVQAGVVHETFVEPSRQRFYAVRERERGRDVARIVFVVDGNAVLFNRARINNWQQAHVDFRTAANVSCASAAQCGLTRGCAIAR